jgi:hypothetical protein
MIGLKKNQAFSFRNLCVHKAIFFIYHQHASKTVIVSFIHLKQNMKTNRSKGCRVNNKQISKLLF